MEYVQPAGALILLLALGGIIFALAKVAGIKVTTILLLASFSLYLTLMTSIGLMKFGDLSGLWWALLGPSMN